jgi:hypothetical protein
MCVCVISFICQSTLIKHETGDIVVKFVEHRINFRGRTEQKKPPHSKEISSFGKYLSFIFTEYQWI